MALTLTVGKVYSIFCNETSTTPFAVVCITILIHNGLGWGIKLSDMGAISLSPRKCVIGKSWMMFTMFGLPPEFDLVLEEAAVEAHRAQIALRITSTKCV